MLERKKEKCSRLKKTSIPISIYYLCHNKQILCALCLTFLIQNFKELGYIQSHCTFLCETYTGARLSMVVHTCNLS